jgi:hypothetical protein
VRFAYECPRRWEELTPTADPGVRHCEGCHEAVYACGSRKEAEDHAQAGRCISIAAALAARVGEEVSRDMTGRPHTPSLWASRLFGDG